MSNIPVADAHCDFLYYMTQDGWDINRPTRNQAVALPYIKQGGGKLLLFAAWVDMDMRKDCLAAGAGYVRFIFYDDGGERRLCAPHKGLHAGR